MSNNKQFEKQKITFKTISPIHIGSGDVIDRFEYIIEDNKVIFIDQNNLIDILKEHNYTEEKNIPDKKRINLADLANVNLGSTINYLEKYYKYIEEGTNSASLQSFINTIEDEELKTRIKNAVSEIYDLDSIQHDKNLTVINLIMKQNGNPLVPGSSIKGAIWSALIYNYYSNDEKNIKDLITHVETSFKNSLKDTVSSIKYFNKSATINIQDLFDKESKYGIKKDYLIEFTKKLSKNISKYSLNDIQKASGKFFMLEDSQEILSSSIMDIKGPKDNKKNNRNEGEEEINYLRYEIINSDQEFTSTITFKKQLLKLYKGNFNKLLENDSQIKKPNVFSSLEDIISSIKLYYKELWAYEKAQYELMNKDSKTMAELVQFYRDHEGKDFIKLGWGSSSIATSIYLIAVKKDIDIKITNDITIKLKDLMQLIIWKGKIPNYNKKEPGLFPLLKKHYRSINKSVYPIGWLEIHFEEVESKC